MKIFLSPPHMSGLEHNYIVEAFDANYIAPVGPQLDAFEYAVADYLGANVHCVALSSGTAALHLGLLVAGVKAKDIVWVSSMTFAGGVFPINYIGAKPVFFDIDPSHWTLNVELVSEQLDIAARSNKLPKAIIPTDLYGQSVRVKELEELCRRYGVKLIIDSAESFGADYEVSMKSGTGGDASLLSFNGNKIITTSGGGMLVTKHKNWAERAKYLSTQARQATPHYEHTEIGYNYRLSNVSAAIGLGQLKVLNQRVEKRRLIFKRYCNELSDLGVEFMPEAQNGKSSRWLTVAIFDPSLCGVDRDAISFMLLRNGVESRPVWKPMHMQPVYKGSDYHGNRFDEYVFENGLCLPSGTNMSDEDQKYVVSLIREYISVANKN